MLKFKPHCCYDVVRICHNVVATIIVTTTTAAAAATTTHCGYDVVGICHNVGRLSSNIGSISLVDPLLMCVSAGSSIYVTYQSNVQQQQELM